MERKRSVRRRRPKKWTSIAKEYFRALIAFIFSNVGVAGLVVCYTTAGAFLFIAIEGSHTRSGNIQVERLRDNLTDRIFKLSCCSEAMWDQNLWTNSVQIWLKDYQEEVVSAIGDGFDATLDLDEKGWSFSGAFLYSLTVITTIGYGNVAPQTLWGKLLTIIYAMIGMPLFLLYLSNIGDLLARAFKWTYSRCRICPKPRKQHVDSNHVKAGEQHAEEADEDEDEEDDDDEEDDESLSDVYDPHTVTVPITLCLAIMVGYICGGAWLFILWEKWTFLDASYFCFISLSTIGFGDIVPGDEITSKDTIEWTFIFCAMYLLLGMAVIAMCFNLMQEEVVAKLHRCGAFIKRCCGTQK